MIKFTEIATRTERKLVQNLYNESIPKHEKIYFYPMWFKRKQKNMSFLNAYDGEKWVGYLFFSTTGDLIYIWLYATIDTKMTRECDQKVLDALKTLYPNHRIGISIESENIGAENKEKSATELAFYLKKRFVETGYFTKEKADSFKIMITGGKLGIEEFYDLNRASYPLIGKFFVDILKKQIKKS